MHTVASWLTTVSVILAFITGLAVRRAPHVLEPPLVQAGRNLILGGWLLLAVRFTYMMVLYGHLKASSISMLAITLAATGCVMVALGLILSGRGDSPCDGCKFRPISFDDFDR